MIHRCGYFTGHGHTTPAIGVDGKPMTRRFLLWRVPLFEFTNDEVDPLTYQDIGGAYQPDRHTFPTDGGSTPPFLWSVPGLNPWLFPRAYPFHDCGFTYGGLYVRAPGCEGFTFRLMGREELNVLLVEMIEADGGYWWDKARVAAGLRIGSRLCWNPEAQAKVRREAGIQTE